MLPSLRLGMPARMTIAEGDHALIDAWLADDIDVATVAGTETASCAVFDSQIVRYEDHDVAGPAHS